MLLLGVPQQDLEKDDKYNVTLAMEDSLGKTDGLEVSWNVLGNGQAFHTTRDFHLTENETL